MWQLLSLAPWIRTPQGRALENKLLNVAFQKCEGSFLHRVISSGTFGALTLKKNQNQELY